MTYDELKRETERLCGLRPAVREELRHIHGIRGVGVGVREQAGALTGELAFRIYVELKLPRAQVPRRERIPRTIFGCPTDVHTVVRARELCCGATRPLLAGLQIEAEPFRQLSDSFGTLGCFLRLPPNNIEVGLSNEHVLASKFETDTRVFQPKYKSCAEFVCNVVGDSIPRLGHKGDYTFNNETHYVDCAVVDFKDVDFVNKLVLGTGSSSNPVPVVLPSNVPGSVTIDEDRKIVEVRDGANAVVDLRAIRGSAAAVANTLVFKVGRTTGLTVGVVTEVAGVGHFADGPIPVEGLNQIMIQPVAGYFGSETAGAAKAEHYTLPGDSGSVSIDLSNRVVGLNHHGTSEGDRHTVASNIAPVLQRLGGATVIADDGSSSHKTAAPSTELARQLWIDSPLAAHDLDNLESEVRRRLKGSPRARELLDLIEAHSKEVLYLVRNRRPVTIAWHRHHGPAFVVLFARALAAEGKPFPEQAGGVSRRALLNVMADVLAEQGGPALRQTIESVRGWLIDLLVDCRDLDDLCLRLREVAA